MRKVRAFIVILLSNANLPTTVTSEYSPFFGPYLEEYPKSYNGFVLDLFRRDGNCGNGVSCSNLGDKASCCKSKSRCAVDMAGMYFSEPFLFCKTFEAQ